jgi:hypothetical protein
MSIPNEALQKVSSLIQEYTVTKGTTMWLTSRYQLVQEIETQAIAAQQQINIVKSQISVKQREIRMLQLTSNEVSTLPTDTNVYEGVGKMYASRSSDLRILVIIPSGHLCPT